MTNQEIFDKVCERLRDGTGQAMEGSGGCSYKNSEGYKCAIGIFIREAHPAQEFTGFVNMLLSVYDAEEVFGFKVNEERLRLMTDLQNTHDDPDFWDNERFKGEGEEELKDIAKEFGLIYTPPS